MTEHDNFSVSNIKHLCRACLRVSEEVYPMTPPEINTYLRLTEKKLVSKTNWLMNICIICKWVMMKCLKFTEQCCKANEILAQSVGLNFIQLTSVIDLKNSTTQFYYMGPDNDQGDVIDDDSIKNDDMVMEDTADDDIPLVMFQTEFKDEWNGRQEISVILEPEIKQESDDIKEESSQDSVRQKRKKKKRKEIECKLKEGFTSRMVQETEEYFVIKLNREQVLSEMAEKAKTDAYIRSPYKCEKCVKGFNFEDVLEKHMVKHTTKNGTYKCEICSQYCPNTVSLRGHLKSHTTRYKCKLCGQVRLSRQHLLEHYAITHTSAPITYTCDKCEFTSNKRTVIQRHVKTHVNRQHSCELCGKLFTCVETLRVHTMRHDKSKRLQCPLCDKQFIYQSLLQKHTQAVHERKEYYCVECDVTFKTPESMRLHFKKAKRHRDSSSYKYSCPQCVKRFVSSATLSVHLTSTHGAPKQHLCEVCNKLYSSKEALRSHQWRSHSQKEELTCHMCCKSFNRKSAIRAHMRTHFRQKPIRTGRLEKLEKQQEIDDSMEVSNVPLES